MIVILFNRVPGCRLPTLLKRDSGTGVFLNLNFTNFKEQIFSFIKFTDYQPTNHQPNDPLAQ